MVGCRPPILAASYIAAAGPEYVPGAQRSQDASDVAAGAAEYVPARHSSQVSAAGGEYVPAKHSSHGTATRPSSAARARECARAWLHSVALFVPVFQVFAGHGRHVLVSGARRLPDGQSAQGAEPTADS